MLPLYDSAKGHEILSSPPDYPVTDPHIVRGPGCSSICTTMKRESYRGLGMVIIHTYNMSMYCHHIQDMLFLISELFEPFSLSS